MEMHIILWVCDRGNAQENERAKSGFIVPVLLDFTNKGIILACADGVLICLVYQVRLLLMKKTVCVIQTVLLCPGFMIFQLGPTYLLSRLHDSLDTFRGYLELSPPDLASGFFSCRFPAAPIGASGCT